MKIKLKCMFLGTQTGTTKNGDTYNRVRWLDKDSNTTIDCYVNSLEKFQDFKLYSDYDCNFDIFKDSKNLWRVNYVL